MSTHKKDWYRESRAEKEMKYTNNNTDKSKGNKKHSTDSNTNSKSNIESKNTKQKGVDINARNAKAKYSDDDIAKKRYADSQAVLLVRDRIHNDNIDTRHKWIDIMNLKVSDKWDNYGNYAPEIFSFDAEIFNKTQIPVYSEDMTEDEKHQLTYDVAKEDIQKQRDKDKRRHKKTYRPIYHVEVRTKFNEDNKTIYRIKEIKQIK